VRGWCVLLYVILKMSGFENNRLAGENVDFSYAYFKWQGKRPW
jgi:hypothetical protein